MYASHTELKSSVVQDSK